MNARILRKWGLQKFVMSSQWITVLTILVVIFVDKCATIDNRRIEYPNMRPFRRKPPPLLAVSGEVEGAAAESSVPNFHSQITLNNNHFNLNNDNDNINYDKSSIRKTSLTSSANIDVNKMERRRNAFLNIPPTTTQQQLTTFNNNHNHNSHVNLQLHPLITKLSPVNDITLNYNGPVADASESDTYRYRRNSIRSSSLPSSYSSYHQRRLHQHQTASQQQQQQMQHHQRQRQQQFNYNNSRPPKKRRRRYCSARDPEQLAFEAPTVFEGKLISMSFDRRANFSISFEVLKEFKTQKGYILPKQVRLQFSYLNGSGECDIYREYLKPRGLVRVNDLEQGRLYYLFVQQIDLANFTILGQPIRKTRHTTEKLLRGVSNQYGNLFFF